MHEALESRVFLSASLANGVLTVIGTSWNDTIHVRSEYSRVVLVVNSRQTTYRLNSIRQIVIDGRGGNDFIVNGWKTVPSRLIGGKGDDMLSGGMGSDTLFGGPGNDRLYGQGGNDRLIGGAGDDLLVGGPGIDTASYEDRSYPVRAFLIDGYGGQIGEYDSLTGIENIRGGSAGDTLVGNAYNNRLWGGAGTDSLDGNGGNDVLIEDDVL